jgi:hypothetical protein
MIARREIFLCDRCVRPQVDLFGYQRTPVGSICGPLAELGRRSCGADVAGWLNATVPVQVLRGFAVDRPADRNLPATFVNQQLREAHRSDVQKLVAVEDATARHIWMWVELAEGLAMIRSFDAEGLPGIDLDVEGIDGVWLGRSPAPEIVAGHLWLRGQGWSEFSVVRNEAALE